MKVIPAAVLIGTFWTSCLRADVVLFGRSTDTIRVDNNLVTLGSAATYEARILFTAQHAGFGLIFNEHTFALEDKQLLAGPEGLRAFSHGLTTETPGEIAASIPLASNVWHHVAYVYDGAQERLYLDGVLVKSRSASGSIRNNSGFAAIGSNYREGAGLRPGFVGYIDTIRISSVARYSGERFRPPMGDLPGDGQAVLLYNFKQSVGQTLAMDESPLNRTGRLGLPPGTSASAPVFTFDPAPTLFMTRTGDQVVLSWRAPFRLQSSTSVMGGFEDVEAAPNPFVVETTSLGERFYRLWLP